MTWRWRQSEPELAVRARVEQVLQGLGFRIEGRVQGILGHQTAERGFQGSANVQNPKPPFAELFISELHGKVTMFRLN